MKNRIRFELKLMALLPLLITGLSIGAGNAASETAETISPVMKSKPEIVMYKPPTCECCSGWAEHMRAAGFSVIVNKSENMEMIKAMNGVSGNLSSCHTAIVDGYVIEGHVPAADVERLLKERPNITGLTAPGMPMQSPGMQAKGLPPKNYKVLSFDKDGNVRVFSDY